jgi:hypothetical protein
VLYSSYIPLVMSFGTIFAAMLEFLFSLAFEEALGELKGEEK